MLSCRSVALALLGFCFAACSGTVMDHPWVDGMSREDAIAIRDLLRREKHVHRIDRFDCQPHEIVDVWTDQGSWEVRRVKGRWIVISQVVITA
jgi:hypothetical protein